MGRAMTGKNQGTLVADLQARGGRALAAVALALACTLGAVGALTLAPTSASAQDVEAARAAFQRGNEAMQSGDFEAAIQHFVEANDLAPNPLLLRYIAQCYTQLDDYVHALEYLRAYADSSPEVEAEVRETIESIEEMLSDAYARAGRTVGHAHRLAAVAGGEQRGDNPFAMVGDPEVVPLQVRSQPEGAEVYIDSTSLGSVGRTPLDTMVFVGPHVVIVSLPHHSTYREVVNIEPLRGGPVPIISATLQRGAANVDISVRPITTRVTYISPIGDVQSLGQGGYEGELPAGPGVFLLQQAGQERRVERTLAVSDGDVEAFTLYLDPAEEARSDVREELATLTIRSNLPFAEITVDRAPVGQGIGEFETQLTPGMHTVRVCQSGYVCAVDNVRLASGERQTWVAPTRLEEESSGVPVGGIVTAVLGAGALATGGVFLASYLGADEGETADLIIGISGLAVGTGLAIASIAMFAGSGPENDASAAQIAPPFQLGVGPGPDGWGFAFGARF